MNYATIKNLDVANGTGLRVSLFVSGCTHHCKGCFNPEAWNFNYGKEFTQEEENKIIDMLGFKHIQGLSLLGGEPFEPENQAGLINLIRRVKQEYPSKTIWAYSGYAFDTEIVPSNGKAHCDVTDELINYIDVLVDGEFKLELKDPRLKFRGSSNQRVIDIKQSLATNNVVLYCD